MFLGDRAAAAALTFVGAVLTLGGLTWGAKNLRSEFVDLRDRLEQAQTLNLSELPREERDAQRNAILTPSSTWNDVLYMRELIRFHVLQQAADNIGMPLGLTLLGVLAGTGASVWSLWL
ncbi:hypothetical protein ACFYWY_27435 [Streptomyces sp. NPDC002870]|uniref:hypothetical protein n=1 Tax=Streptomyces sp. NPDC002870 TaxID=3364666 RepID=UPI0036CAC20E